MSMQGLKGISQVIKANTTEKSIDDLRAEGKKRVRVVSSERVMAIIQAIVDDTIASEVGEITKRDRDRIVSDTQSRFSHVLKMQQDLEQDVDELRGSLLTAETERERLRADKTILESQLEIARQSDGDTDAVSRLARDLARVRDSVERMIREPAKGVDDAALARIVERLAAHDAQTARRLGTELDEIRERVERLGREAAAARDKTAESLVERVREQQTKSEAQLCARLDREFKGLAANLAEVRAEAARAPAAGDAVARLRESLDGLEKRVHGVERSSSELAARVAESVTAKLDAREAAAGAKKADAFAAHAAELTAALRQMQNASDEDRERIVSEVRSLRESADRAQKLALNAQAEHLRDLEQSVSANAAERTDALARSVGELAEQTAKSGASLQALRADFAAFVDSAATQSTTAPEAVLEALAELRLHAADSSARTADVHSAVTAGLGGSLAQLRGEIEAMRTRSAETAERQHEAVRALADRIAQSSSAQSDSLQATFRGALEQALDKIERTMKSATARPIEMDGEATDVLLAKMFDDPDSVLTSNLDQLDVEQRRSTGSIAKSVGRLKEMNGTAKPAAKKPA